MSPSENRQRIVIALTESSSAESLWRTAIEASRKSESDMVALFIDDERWELAASLPFTREIPRLGGAPVEQEMQRLADAAGVKLAFEKLRESDLSGLAAVLGHERVVLIADAPLTSRPVYAQFTRFECQVLLVDGGDGSSAAEPRDTHTSG